MTPPASTEPMYLISESELFDLDGTSDDEIVFNAVRARGPAAQQAPALDEKDRIFVLLSDPETRREIVDRLSQPWSIEILQEIERIRKEHDAALIAQEREKWERERLSCVEDITPEGAAIVQAVKKQAREDVLREIDMRIEAGISALHEQGVDGSLPIVVHEKLEVLAWVRQIVEFLRPGQEREPE